MTEWLSIETAPTWQAVVIDVGHGMQFVAIKTDVASGDCDGKTIGVWRAVFDGHYPVSWIGGVHRTWYDDGEDSLYPAKWRHIKDGEFA